MASHSLKTLFLVIFLEALLYVVYLLATDNLKLVYYARQISVDKPEGGCSNGPPIITVMVDDTVVENISKIFIENLRKDAFICKEPIEDHPQALPMIYIITPTYKRYEQIPDLTRLAQTLMHVPSITWLVIEDAANMSSQVSAILRRSNITFFQMLAPMPAEQRKRRVKAKGVSNRNKGLEWIRNNTVDPNGVVYFADDDNTYDLRLFPEIRSVKKIGMWPVGLLTTYGLSSPIVTNGSVTGYYDGWVAGRKYPVDMAGFAVSVSMILKNRNVTMPFSPGREEDGFIRGFHVKDEEIEPKADNCTKIYVWHTRTRKNREPVKLDMKFNKTNILKLYEQII